MEDPEREGHEPPASGSQGRDLRDPATRGRAHRGRDRHPHLRDQHPGQQDRNPQDDQNGESGQVDNSLLILI